MQKLLSFVTFSFLFIVCATAADASRYKCIREARKKCNEVYKQEKKDQCDQFLWKNIKKGCREQRKKDYAVCGTANKEDRKTCTRSAPDERTKATCKQKKETAMEACKKIKGAGGGCLQSYRSCKSNCLAPVKGCRTSCFKNCTVCTVAGVKDCVKKCTARVAKNCQKCDAQKRACESKDTNIGAYSICKYKAQKAQRSCLRVHTLGQWRLYYKCLSKVRAKQVHCHKDAWEKLRYCYVSYDVKRLKCKHKILGNYNACVDKAKKDCK